MSSNASNSWIHTHWRIAYDTVHSVLQTILDTIENTFQLVYDDEMPTTVNRTDRTDWAAVYRYFDENNISPYEDRHGGGDCGREWPIEIEGQLTDYDGDLDV